MLSINTVASKNASLASWGFQIEKKGIVNPVISNPEKSDKGMVYSTKPFLTSTPSKSFKNIVAFVAPDSNFILEFRKVFGLFKRKFKMGKSTDVFWSFKL